MILQPNSRCYLTRSDGGESLQHRRRREATHLGRSCRDQDQAVITPGKRERENRAVSIRCLSSRNKYKSNLPLRWMTYLVHLLYCSVGTYSSSSFVVGTCGGGKLVSPKQTVALAIRYPLLPAARESPTVPPLGRVTCGFLKSFPGFVGGFV